MYEGCVCILSKVGQTAQMQGVATAAGPDAILHPMFLSQVL